MAKFCSRCGTKTGLFSKRLEKPEGRVCEKCFTPDEVKEFERLHNPPPWICSQCGMPNPAIEFTCKSCGVGYRPDYKK